MQSFSIFIFYTHVFIFQNIKKTCSFYGFKPFMRRPYNHFIIDFLFLEYFPYKLSIKMRHKIIFVLKTSQWFTFHPKSLE